MYRNQNPHEVLLVDCDGVLVDWETKFHSWMLRHGYESRDQGEQHYRVCDRYIGVSDDLSGELTRRFNESAAVANMTALRDSVYWVRRLNWKMGFRFVVITSLSSDPDAQALRRQNLYNLFGDIFDSIVCLDTGSDKHQALDHYRDSGCWWIEDKPENALVGLERGLKPILMAHDHNRDFQHDHVPRVQTWREIYDIIYASA